MLSHIHQNFNLDNTAAIHMASKNKNWSNMFRLSATLNEPVDVDILQSSVNEISKRFPTIISCIKKGFFSYYQQSLKTPLLIEKETELLKPMSNKTLANQAIRILYNKHLIHIEFFHAITDGKGGVVFLKALLYEYLKQKENLKINDSTILKAETLPEKEELDDAYTGITTNFKYKAKHNTQKTFQISDQQVNTLKTQHFTIDINNIKPIARKMNISLTVLITSLIIMSIQEIQNKEIQNKKHKAIRVFLPIDLRNIFNSKTLRNFVLYSKPEINPKNHNYNLTDIISTVNTQLQHDLEPNLLASKIVKNINIQNKKFIKFMPLFIKNIIMKLAFLYSEKTTCLTITNMGMVNLPKEMSHFINSMSCILNTRSRTPYNCSVLTYNNKLQISFIRNINNAKIENEFSNLLKNLNINFEQEEITYN